MACLPDLYTDQGYGWLKFLIGHLKLGDEIGKLILIAISHLHLNIGAESPFFSCSYPPYAKWVEHNWLTNIWKHTNQLQITVDMESHWKPRCARQQDLVLMDEFMKYKFSLKQLGMINSCRLYLPSSSPLWYNFRWWTNYPFYYKHRLQRITWWKLITLVMSGQTSRASLGHLAIGTGLSVYKPQIDHTAQPMVDHSTIKMGMVYWYIHEFSVPTSRR